MKSEEVLKFSVIILMYNNSLNQILLTTKSVIQQKLDDIEIIFADDGSELQYKNEIEHFLIKNKFMNYCFAPSDKNLGTVCNILRAIPFARGRFIKCIGAGDYLFDENVLNDVYSFMVQNDCQWIFGKMRGYYIQNFQIIGNKFNILEKMFARRSESNRNNIAFDSAKDNVVLQGACIIFSRKYIECEKTAFLPDTFMYGEEDLLAYYCQKRGYKMRYDPMISILHKDGSSTKSSCRNNLDKNIFFTEHALEGTRILARKMREN